ncbi:MAG TPA: hypothetical protein VMZ25_00850 [Terriglobales bacterium]|nr:hypothetical protein [Terriglobales bacterium]
MSNPMKARIKELGDAINETLSNSEQIAEVIGRIKDEGYDVFLVLEATVGFNRQDGEAAADAPDNVTEMPLPEPELKVNAQDMRFLKSLRISVDDAA